MNALRIVVVIAAAMLTLAVAPNTECMIRGRVVDPKLRPIAGVNIIIKGTPQGTVTDARGYFQISTEADSLNLLFALNGKRSVERVVTDICREESIQVVMQESRHR